MNDTAGGFIETEKSGPATGGLLIGQSATGDADYSWALSGTRSQPQNALRAEGFFSLGL